MRSRTSYRYRDHATGRFVSRKKWQRSHGPHGRYKRETIQRKRAELQKRAPQTVQEWETAVREAEQFMEENDLTRNEVFDDEEEIEGGADY